MIVLFFESLEEAQRAVDLLEEEKRLVSAEQIGPQRWRVLAIERNGEKE